ncbi:MAG: alpha/beta hydrolase [Chitinophagaceae bacterium]|nr:alpha/beta hydrolase [Chitinophagaceae bacterium]
MERHQLTYKGSQVSYLRFGVGSKTAFCFHGYGEEAATFSFLEKYAGNEYTFYAIDLPFHGQTIWNEGYDFSLKDLREIINTIQTVDDHSPETTCRHITLIGFSLGGRVALSLYQTQPANIDKLVLLAPDGLKINFWYWLSTQTQIGNRLFALTMKKPRWFFGFLQLLNKLRLVNSSIFKFVNYYIGDPEVRELLYARWMVLRKLKPGLESIRSLVRNHKTSVRLIYGEHDRIILPVRGEKFRKGIEGYCTLSVIHSGHQVLHEKHVKEILPALLY